MVVSATKPSPKTDARWARTRQRLIAGGREVFAELGVDATSVLDIVRAAGVSQPSFYNHFTSKEELAQEIATEFFLRDRDAKQAIFAACDDPAEAIAINVRQTLAMAVDDPVIAWTLLKSHALRQLVISSDNDLLVRMLRSGMKSGRFIATEPRTVALAIRGGALAIVQDILNGTAKPNASARYQELVLRMLGLPAADSAAVVRRANARS